MANAAAVPYTNDELARGACALNGASIHQQRMGAADVIAECTSRDLLDRREASAAAPRTTTEPMSFAARARRLFARHQLGPVTRWNDLLEPAVRDDRFPE